jgi:hypothetical protein
MPDKVNGAGSIGYMDVMGNLASTLRKKRIQSRKESSVNRNMSRPQGEGSPPYLKMMDNPGGDGHVVSHVPEDRHVDAMTTLAEPETRAAPGVLNPPRPEPGDRNLKDGVMNYQKHDHGATKAPGQSGPAKPQNVYSQAKAMTDPKMGRDTDYHGNTLGKGYSAPTDDWKGQNAGPKAGQMNKGGDHAKPDDKMYDEDALRGMLADLSATAEKPKSKSPEASYTGRKAEGMAAGKGYGDQNVANIRDPKKRTELIESKDIGHMVDPGHYQIRDTKKGYKLRRK